MAERAAEATRDPVWIVERRRIHVCGDGSYVWCSECEGYYIPGCDGIAGIHGDEEGCDGDTKSSEEILKEDSEQCLVSWLGSGNAFLSRAAATGWAKRRDHRYPEGWRVFCYALPLESALTQILRDQAALGIL